MLEWGSAEAHPSVTISCAARIVIEPFCVRTVGDRGGRIIMAKIARGNEHGFGVTRQTTHLCFLVGEEAAFVALNLPNLVLHTRCTTSATATTTATTTGTTPGDDLRGAATTAVLNPFPSVVTHV